MDRIIFKSANVPVQTAARALGVDPQTIRVMIREGLVPWGQAVKLPGSSKLKYLISPLLLYQTTGFFYDGEAEE